MAITWKDVKNASLTKRYTCSNLKKRNVYIAVSYLLSIFVAVALFSDCLCLFVTENTLKTTHQFSMAVLLLHTIGFYLGMLGFVYTTQTAGKACNTVKISLISIGGHIIVFVLRVALELSCIGYREEYYRSAPER